MFIVNRRVICFRRYIQLFPFRCFRALIKIWIRSRLCVLLLLLLLLFVVVAPYVVDRHVLLCVRFVRI